MKRMAMVVLAIAAMTACQRERSFCVEGTITDAADSVLYLYNRSMNGIILLDSAILDDEGDYSFEQPAPVGPDLYVLRIADQIINLAVDSTETITINGSMPGLAVNYQVSGSEGSEKIRQLQQMHSQLQRRVLEVEQDPSLLGPSMIDSLRPLIRQYKDTVLMNYIFQAPQSAYAYFALSQTLDHVYWQTSHIFELGDSVDDRAYRAVATCWKEYYPESNRAQQLYNMVEREINNSRIIQARQQQFSDDQIVVSDIIDLSLPDIDGRQRTLSSLRGKVVLLDFHVFAMDESPARILTLRELYNKFHAQGLEVFQVSLDSDEHFWKQQTAALPWINVFDPDGLQSQYVMMYNMQAVPDFFLIDRNNNLVKRAAQIKDLEAEIKKLL